MYVVFDLFLNFFYPPIWYNFNTGVHITTYIAYYYHFCRVIYEHRLMLDFEGCIYLNVLKTVSSGAIFHEVPVVMRNVQMNECNFLLPGF